MNQHKFTGDLESFADYFMKDRRKNNVTPLFKCAVKVDLKHLLCILFTVYSSPYFPHLLDAWTKRHHPNLLFIFYEDLKRVTFTWLCNSFVGCLYLTFFPAQDLRGEIQKIGRFLGRYPNEYQLNKMVEHLRIDKFATNKSVNFEHYRWLNFMSPDGRFIRNGELFFFHWNLFGKTWNFHYHFFNKLVLII